MSKSEIQGWRCTWIAVPGGNDMIVIIAFSRTNATLTIDKRVAYPAYDEESVPLFMKKQWNQ